MPSDQITNRGESPPATRSEVDTFLADLKRCAGPSIRGRLIFALDATASRQPTWDTACELQAEMFREAATTGGLDMQLVYYTRKKVVLSATVRKVWPLDCRSRVSLLHFAAFAGIFVLLWVALFTFGYRRGNKVAGKFAC